MEVAGRLSPVRFGLAGILALVGAWSAFRAWDDAHYAYLRSTNGLTAHAARPTDGVALAKAVEATLRTRADIQASDGELKAALAQTPISRALLRIVGMKAELNGDVARADKAMRLSNAVSRRDAMAQLWLIERSVAENDMDGALSHYNAALSVHPELGQALFPVLVKAMIFPEVRTALRPYIRRQAPWSGSLINYAVAQGDAVNTALLVISAGKVMQDRAHEATNARLISKLAESGRFDFAYRLAHTVVPKFDPRKIGALAVSAETTDTRLGSLAWSFAEEGPVLASANELGGFEVEIQSLSRGTVASRSIAVVGGRTYSFDQTVRNEVSGAAPSFVWKASCLSAEAKASFWEQALPARRGIQQQELVLAVPSECRGIRLVLDARGPDGQQPAHVTFEGLYLRPRSE